MFRHSIAHLPVEVDPVKNTVKVGSGPAIPVEALASIQSGPNFYQIDQPTQIGAPGRFRCVTVEGLAMRIFAFDSSAPLPALYAGLYDLQESQVLGYCETCLRGYVYPAEGLGKLLPLDCPFCLGGNRERPADDDGPIEEWGRLEFFAILSLEVPKDPLETEGETVTVRNWCSFGFEPPLDEDGNFDRDSGSRG